jgi:hypothetical protein
MKVLKFIVVCTLLLSWNQVNSQLNIKKPDLDKVKDKAKDKVDDKKSDTKEKAKDKVEEKKEDKVKETENKVNPTKSDDSNKSTNNSDPFSDNSINSDSKPVLHEMHKKNVSKVVFSTSRINKATNDESLLISSFKLTDPILGYMYMEEPEHDAFKRFGEKMISRYMKVIMIFTIDGVEYINNPGMEKFDVLEYYSYSIGLGNLENFSKNSFDFNASKDFAYVLSKIPAGNHKVKIEIKPSINDWEVNSKRPQPTWAVGEFDVTFTEAERDAFVKKNGLKFEEWGGKPCTDASFSSMVVKQVPKAIRTFVTEPIVERSYYGVVTHRIAYLRTIEKNEDGDGEIVNYDVRQEFIGNKWDNKVSVNESNRNPVNIPHQNYK